MKTALYRHWDEHGQLLYVGISLSAVQRLSQHKHSSPWFDLIANVTIEWFNTREEAVEAERLAIEDERPLYNKAHNAANDNRPAQRSMAVYLVREIATEGFEGLFWAENLDDLWDTLDEIVDPYGYEYARVTCSGALYLPGRHGTRVQQRDEMNLDVEDPKPIGWGRFSNSENLETVLRDMDALEWEPFCAADEANGVVARAIRAAAA